MMRRAHGQVGCNRLRPRGGERHGRFLRVVNPLQLASMIVRNAAHQSPAVLASLLILFDCHRQGGKLIADALRRSSGFAKFAKDGPLPNHLKSYCGIHRFISFLNRNGH